MQDVPAQSKGFALTPTPRCAKDDDNPLHVAGISHLGTFFVDTACTLPYLGLDYCGAHITVVLRSADGSSMASMRTRGRGFDVEIGILCSMSL